MKRLIFSTGLLCLFFNRFSQGLTQTVRGTITDQDSEFTLIGATVQIVEADPIIGVVTDIDGNFRLENVPVGRVNLKISYIGYEDKVLPNLLVDAAKEVILNVSLTESISSLKAVVVSAKKNKSEVLNEMSVVSARSFSVDETKRYAGSFNDPARMVSSFAGVTSNAEGNNDIVVRGNSPKGILWRLEGIEIPNPNHFAWEGSTGGPINALNSNMLSDSDFFSGAFSPEYGNALSGVFDMKLKKGNNQRKEYTANMSTLGLDFTVEGPCSSGYNGSYLVNYRYSSLQLLDDLGVIDFGGVPKYQDIAFNFYMPLNEKHYLSLFGLGGLSSIDSEWEEEGNILVQSKYGTGLGVVGLTHQYFINENSFLKTSLSAAGTKLTSDDEWAEEDFSGFFDIFNTSLTYSNIKLSSTYNLKINAKHKVETGGILTRHYFDLFTDSYDFDTELTVRELEDNGHADLFQGYASWKYRMSEKVTAVSGLHYMHFNLNGANSIEPRFGLQWELTPRGKLSAGVGVHSKVENISTYLSKTQNDDGTMANPNRNLEPSKAIHYVLGYSYLINSNTHFKVEAYYQNLFDVPIEDSDTSSFTSINLSDGYINRYLVNEGSARNYGMEFTLERYLHNGLYYMGTVSVYESRYTAGDGIERQTAFNGNFVGNFLMGKEFKFGKSEKNRTMFVNSKVSLIGGNPYTPILLDESIEAGYGVRDEASPYSVSGDDIWLVNISWGIRRNKKTTSREFKIDVQNAINGTAVVNTYYVPHTQRVGDSHQLPLLPTISYTFSF